MKSPKKKSNDDEEQDAKLLYNYPENTGILEKRSNINITEEDFIIHFIFDKDNFTIFNKFENFGTIKAWLNDLFDRFYESFILFNNSFKYYIWAKETPETSLLLTNEKSEKSIVRDFVLNYFKYIDLLILVKLYIIVNLQYLDTSLNL